MLMPPRACAVARVVPADLAAITLIMLLTLRTNFVETPR
jgi:hypothetical protein